MNKSIAIMLVSATLCGCAFGRKQDYLQASPVLSYSAKAPLAIGVHDQRPYVVNKDKEESFVGLQRGGYGNPFDVLTQSRKPLADDMARVLAKSLERVGAPVTVVPLAPGLSHAQAINQLCAGGEHKALLLTLKEWKADTMGATELVYDVTLDAIAPDGKVMATKHEGGSDVLGAGFFDPQGVAQEEVPKAFSKKVQELYSGDVERSVNRE